jgi:hypothetical protein
VRDAVDRPNEVGKTGFAIKAEMVVPEERVVRTFDRLADSASDKFKKVEDRSVSGTSSNGSEKGTLGCSALSMSSNARLSCPTIP